MDATDILSRFRNLQIGMSGDARAPHKPLLALWAIGRSLRRQERLVTYRLIDRELSGLMSRFGPHGRRQNTHHPFWRLQHDQIWEVKNANLVRTTESGDPYKTDLHRHQICGGLTDAAYVAFHNHPTLARQVAGELVAKHFPPTLHDEILDATIDTHASIDQVEMEFRERWITHRRRWRDSTFCKRILEAYASVCAICEFSVQFLDLSQPLAIDAAHIKWHECNGPAVVENGLALCALHHRLFDAGAFTVLPDLKVIVSPDIKGHGVDRALGQYDSKYLRSPPRRCFPRPSPRFLLWHGREVFKSPKILASI